MTRESAVGHLGRSPLAAALVAATLSLLAAPAFAAEPTIGSFTGPFDAAAFRRETSSSTVTVPGLGVSFTATRLVGVQDGAVAFQGTYIDSATGTSRSGLYATRDGIVSSLADAQHLMPGGEAIRSIVATSEWVDGQLTFAANTSAGQRLYRLNAGGALTTLVASGESVNGASTIASFNAKGVAGDADGFAFSATLADGSQAFYQSVGTSKSSLISIADDKTRSPVPETGLYVDFPEMAYRGGLAAFIPRALETDRDDAAAEPIGVVLAQPGNPTRLAAFKTGQIVGSPDTDFRFNEFEKPRLFDHAGGLALGFTGGFSDEDAGSEEHFMGVFTIDQDGGWKNWINSDLPLPGLRDDVAEFNGYAISDEAFAAGAVDEAGGRYIYAEIDGAFEYVLSTYDTLDGKPISAIRWTADDIEGSRLYFTAEFADGSSGVYSVVVPEPASALLVCGFAIISRRRCRG